MLKNGELTRTLTLQERARQLRSSFTGSDNVSLSVLRAKTKWWIGKFFNGSKALFSAHLRRLDLTESDLSQLTDFRQLTPSVISETLAHLWTDDAAYSVPEIIAGSWQGFGFENLCFPLLSYMQTEITSALSRLNKNGLNADNTNVLRDADLHIRTRLASLITPALVLQANLQRLNENANMADAGERFRSFILSCKLSDTQATFWAKYPALWRIVSSIVKNSTHACIETLQRIANDRLLLETAFSIPTSSQLSSIAWGVGDAHSQGRVVAILRFSEHNLVYKPKSMAVDLAFADFILWFSAHCKTIKLASIQIHDAGEYGYRSFVEPGPCHTYADVKEFYNRLGALIAIAWILGITDLHHENIIASGAHPYIIDVEAMFNRPVRYRKHNTPSHQDLYQQASQDSLLGTGLLPFRMLGPDGVFDLSAIGARGEQAGPIKAMMIENVGRDDIRIVPQKSNIQQENNVPIIDGNALNSRDYVGEIVAGFQIASDTVDKYKFMLSTNSSIVKRFQEADVRYIARGTVEYGQLLQKMAHPTIARDAIECDMLIAGTLNAQLRHFEHYTSLIPFETNDLWEGDIPFFYMKPDSKDLFSSTGKQIPDFFEDTGFDAYVRRLNLLSEYRERHVRVIRGAINSTRPRVPKEFTPFAQAVTQEDATPEALVDMANAIGRKILSDVFYTQGTPFWVGFTPLDNVDFGVRLSDTSFYDGLPGIGLFFAYLSRYVRNKDFEKIAHDAHRVVRNLIRTYVKARVRSCGAYNGMAGLIFADFHLSHALQRPLMKRLDLVFRHLAKSVKMDKKFDIISGASGALIVALKCYRSTGDLEAFAAARAAAERLADSFEVQEQGIAWPTLESKPLAGMAHGASGIAWALAEWAEETKEDRWRDLALRAFNYVYSLYDENSDTWGELRGDSSVCFWCYGANGIGLAAHNMKHVLSRDIRDKILEIAKRTTLRHGLLANHCLCHGNLGNSDLFLLSGERDLSSFILRNVVSAYNLSGSWSCDLPGGDTTPGFMCGEAGIGYSLLRHAYPDAVPSILSLELPPII
jgi:type 2 lantibiotic biosynthesis protein LanM